MEHFAHRLIELDALIPYALNSRTHSDEQVSQIAASIREFGFTNPVLVDEKNNLIAGHGRVMAARKLGLAEVPAIIVTGLDERRRRALIIADNKLALNAGWDTEVLRVELEDLAADYGALMGFSEDELAALLAEAANDNAPEGEDNLTDPPVNAVTVQGDVWVMGKHRLMCGDSLDMDAARTLMGNAQADLAFCSMAFTDPPWNVAYGEDGDKGGRAILNDSQPEEQWQTFMRDFAASLFDVTKPGAPVYVVMGSQEWPVMDAALREARFHWSSTIVWVKDNFVMTRKDYHAQFEPIWYGWNGTAARLAPLDDRTQSDVWEFPRPKASPYHPMTKPVELIERALTNSSKKSGVVVDLFGGSGSTLVACEKTGRQARVMELDPRYCDVIVKRWQELTGKQAKLQATGQSFADVEAGRVSTDAEVA